MRANRTAELMPTSSNGPRAHAVAIAFVAASLVCAMLVQPHAEQEDLAMIHLLGIVFLALKSSVRVSVLASLLSIALFDFFFIKPRFEFAWTDAKSSITFLAMIFVAFTVSSLSENQRRQEQRARAVAFRAQTLYELNVELSSSRDIRQLSAVTARHLESLFGARVNILMGTLDGGLEAAAGPRSAAAAQKALLRREFITERAAAGTTIWVPVSGVRSTLGVIELEVSEPFERDSEQGYVLMACANQFGTAVEGAQTAGAMQRAKFEAETERMRSSLLSAVSHDLRTPLATMIAAGTTLASKRSELPEEDTETLISSIVSEGQRLNRLISNLLSVTRLESATVEIRRSPESIEDIVRSALDRLASRHHMLPVTTHFHSAPLPLVSAEPLLLEQVLVNLIENAVVHAATPVSVEVLHAPGAASVTVQVADRGPGIAEHEREKVFEKFYRGGDKPRGDGGVGLGLTICRAIVRAHEGRIAVRDRNGGGAIVEFSVPLAEERVVSLEALS